MNDRCFRDHFLSSCHDHGDVNSKVQGFFLRAQIVPTPDYPDLAQCKGLSLLVKISELRRHGLIS